MALLSMPHIIEGADVLTAGIWAGNLWSARQHWRSHRRLCLELCQLNRQYIEMYLRAGIEPLALGAMPESYEGPSGMAVLTMHLGAPIIILSCLWEWAIYVIYS